MSPATVSRALANSPLVNERTRQRVWDVAERLRFTPNRLASSLRRGATLAVGMVVPDVATRFYAAALKGVQDVIQDAGYHVLVVNTERDALRERAALDSLRAHQVDGLIVATSGGYVDMGVPAVFFDNVPVDVHAPAILLDNAGGVMQLVEHVARVHGHGRIAYIGPPDTVGTGAPGGPHGAGRERLEAFRAAVGRCGLALPPEYVRLGPHADWDASGQRLAAELLALAEPPTAIVAGADLFAVGALRGARAAGRAVPGDVALVSFDEPEFADLLEPSVTALDRHDRQLGRRAAELLLDALRGGMSAEIARVPLALTARRSCGCGA